MADAAEKGKEKAEKLAAAKKRVRIAHPLKPQPQTPCPNVVL